MRGTCASRRVVRVSRSICLSAMGAIWSALLVGGGLAGALFVWLLRDKGQEGDAEAEKDSLRGEAEPLSGDQGGGGLSSGPSRPEPIRKAGILPRDSLELLG